MKLRFEEKAFLEAGTNAAQLELEAGVTPLASRPRGATVTEMRRAEFFLQALRSERQIRTITAVSNLAWSSAVVASTGAIALLATNSSRPQWLFLLLFTISTAAALGGFVTTIIGSLTARRIEKNVENFIGRSANAERRRGRESATA